MKPLWACPACVRALVAFCVLFTGCAGNWGYCLKHYNYKPIVHHAPQGKMRVFDRPPGNGKMMITDERRHRTVEGIPD